MEAEQPWHQQDYNWNPFRLVATPASDGQLAGEQASMLPPVSAAAATASDFAASVRFGSGLAPISGLESTLDPRQRSRTSTICQVEGCSESLKSLKEYHQRYKICEYHLKVSSIIREGARQRFCQQCGRFHDLSEFDGDKRSCRARLQRHNARRRKKADSDAALKVVSSSRKSGGNSSMRRSSTSPSARDAAVRAGGRLSAARAALVDDGGSSAVSSGNGDLQGGSPPGREVWGAGNGVAGGNSTGSERGGPRPNLENALSELLQDSQNRHQGAAVSLEAIQEFLDDGRRSQQGGSSAAGLLGSGLPPLGHSFSDGAFGSAPPLLPGAFGGTGPDYFSLQKQFQSGGGSASLPLPGMGGMSGGGAANSGLHFGGMSGLGSGGLSPTTRQLHSMGSAPLPMDVGMEQPGSAGNAGNAQLIGNGIRSPSDQSTGTTAVPDVVMQGMVPASGSMQVQGPTAASVLKEAHALLSSSGYHTEYESESSLTRLSAKLFNCTPDHLPPDLKNQLVNLLQCGTNGLQGYIRPGCTHLTLDAVLDTPKAALLCEGGVRSAAAALVSSATASFWAKRTFTLQMFDEVALVRAGRVLHVVSGSGSRHVFPAVEAVSPRFLATGEPPLVVLSGRNLANPQNFVCARNCGQHVAARVVARAEAGDDAPGGHESILVQLDRGCSPGALFLEAARGGFLSAAAPLLMAPDAAAAAELRQMESAGISEEQLQAVILDMDRVLQYGATLHAVVRGQQLPPGPAFQAEDVAAIAAAAQKLLVFACEKGWPAVARLVLPTACASSESVGDVMDALQCRVTANLTPLHLAVRSGSADLVRLLLGWASAGGYEWSVNVPGPHGITPLHLAALLPDCTIAELLVGGCVGGAASWFAARADDASVPADFATDAALNRRIRALTEVGRTRAGEAEAAGSSSQGESFVEEVIQKPSGRAGKAAEERAKGITPGPNMPPQLYEDYYMDCDMFGLAFAPTVFDRTSSALTAAIILGVGGATLLLRHCVDALAF